MTRNEFFTAVDKLDLYNNGSSIEIAQDYLKITYSGRRYIKDKSVTDKIDKFIRNNKTLSIEHNTGGVSGGSCWENSNPRPYSNLEKMPEFESLYKVLEDITPNISFLMVRKIENSIIHEFDYTQYEYYGNESSYHVKYILLDELFDFLKENNLI